MKDLSNLPKAPRRFSLINEDTWIASPSISYGVIRRIAYEERKLCRTPYLRVLYGEAGRRGDPWGGLSIEANGKYFQFGCNVKRWPHFHDGNGNLTEEGKSALAVGVPGFISTIPDWRWVQDEVELTRWLDRKNLKKIVTYFQDLENGAVPIPMFQSQIWAKRYDVEICPDYHNCTTIIMGQLAVNSGITLKERMPLSAFDELAKLSGTFRSKTDDKLNYFLSLSEEEVSICLEKTARANGSSAVNWKEVLHQQTPLPHWLTWESLLLP